MMRSATALTSFFGSGDPQAGAWLAPENRMSVEATMLQKANRAKLREMLMRLQKQTSDRIRELRRDEDQEAETGPADEMDLARATQEVETHAGLVAGAEEKLRFLDEALTRLEQGRYGSCLGCHGPIPIERLTVLPFAAYCVDCQQKRNRAHHDWAEGVMIQPYDQQWTLPEEMAEPTEREHRSTAIEEELAVGYREPAKRAAPGRKKKASVPTKPPGARRRK
jgi:DnaK suppressor protein